jgi:hypothetical protein
MDPPTQKKTRRQTIESVDEKEDEWDGRNIVKMD